MSSYRRPPTTGRRSRPSPYQRQAANPSRQRRSVYITAGAVAAAVAAARQRRRWERQKRDRVEEAAKFCSDVLTAGWQDAVTDRVAGYITDKATRRRLVRRRPKRQCTALAQLASAILAAKQKTHDLVGRSTEWLASYFGAGEVAQVVARELASKLPLPSDAQFVAVARGLQITGILLCVVDGRELIRCPCFIDLALAESKARVKQILVAALDDWTGLAAFRPSNRARTAGQ